MFRKLAVVILLPLLCVAALIYGLFPVYAPAVASKLLSSQGLTLKRLDLGYPAWRRLSIDAIAIEKEGVALVELHAGTLTFPAGGPLTAHFKNGTLRRMTEPPPSETRNANALLSTLLPNQWLPSVPEFRFQIDVMIAEAFQFDLLTLFKSAGKLGFDSSIAPGETGDKYRLQAAIDADNYFTLTFDGLSEQKTLIAVNSVWELEDGQIKSEFNGHALLHELAFMSANPFLDATLARLNLGGTLTAPDQTLVLEALVKVEIDVAAEFQLEAQRQDVRVHIANTLTLDKGQVTLQIATSQKQNSNQILLVRKDNARSRKLRLHVREAFDIIVPEVFSADFDVRTIGTQGRFRASFALDEKNAGQLEIRAPALVESSERLVFMLDLALQKDLLTRMYPTLPVKVVDDPVRLKAEINSGTEHTRVTLTEATSIKLDGDKFDSSGIEYLSITLPEQSVDVNHQTFSTSAIELTLALNQTDSATTARAEVTLEAITRERANARLAMSSARVNDFELPDLHLFAGLKLADSEALTAELELRNACQHLLAIGQWQHDQPKLLLSINQSFSESYSLIHWLNQPQLPFDLQQGRVQGTLLWQDPADNTLPVINLALSGGRAISEFAALEDVQMQFSSRQLTSPQTSEFTFGMTANKADVGVPLADLKIAAELDRRGSEWWIALEQARASAFGGSVTIAENAIKLDDEIKFTLQLENLDLEDLVATQQLQGLNTTGKLSGGLPITLDGDNIFLGEGRVYNLSGGTIRYISPDKASMELNEQLKLTLDVLENFNYRVLETEIDFADGRLLLQSKISGNNPDVAGGQQVDLNLNTDIDLKSTMEVMRLQTGLESRIEKFVNQNLGANSADNPCEIGRR